MCGVRLGWVRLPSGYRGPYIDVCGWHIAVGAGGNYWRFGVIVGPLANPLVCYAGLGDRWPEVAVGSRRRRWGLGEWQTDEGWTVTGWGPFWRARREGA
jgi:hypothetical protein